MSALSDLTTLRFSNVIIRLHSRRQLIGTVGWNFQECDLRKYFRRFRLGVTLNENGILEFHSVHELHFNRSLLKKNSEELLNKIPKQESQ